MQRSGEKLRTASNVRKTNHTDRVTNRAREREKKRTSESERHDSEEDAKQKANEQQSERAKTNAFRANCVAEGPTEIDNLSDRCRLMRNGKMDH